MWWPQLLRRLRREDGWRWLIRAGGRGERPRRATKGTGWTLLVHLASLGHWREGHRGKTGLFCSTGDGTAASLLSGEWVGENQKPWGPGGPGAAAAGLGPRGSTGRAPQGGQVGSRDAWASASPQPREVRTGRAWGRLRGDPGTTPTQPPGEGIGALSGWRRATVSWRGREMNPIHTRPTPPAPADSKAVVAGVPQPGGGRPGRPA